MRHALGEKNKKQNRTSNLGPCNTTGQHCRSRAGRARSRQEKAAPAQHRGRDSREHSLGGARGAALGWGTLYKNTMNTDIHRVYWTLGHPITFSQSVCLFYNNMPFIYQRWFAYRMPIWKKATTAIVNIPILCPNKLKSADSVSFELVCIWLH